MFHFRTVYLIFSCIAFFFILSFFKRREIIFRKALLRRKGIVLHSLLHTAIADVGIDLRGVELLVTEYILEHSHVDLARLVHKSSRGVSELVHRIVLGFKSRKLEILIDQPLYRLDADALLTVAKEECLSLGLCVFFSKSLGIVIGKCLLAGRIEIYYSLLIAFTRNGKRAQIAVNVVEVDTDKLGDSHSAVEE